MGLKIGSIYLFLMMWAECLFLHNYPMMAVHGVDFHAAAAFVDVNANCSVQVCAEKTNPSVSEPVQCLFMWMSV